MRWSWSAWCVRCSSRDASTFCSTSPACLSGYDGLCNIVESFIKTQRSGVVLKLAGVNAHLREVLNTTKLLSVFDVYDSDAEALASFATHTA